jgi:cobalt/nickel transport system permease protein
MSIKLAIDQHIGLNSPLHRWDPRPKLVGLLALIFAFAMVESWKLLPWMILVTTSFYALSQLPLHYWLSRVRYPGIFLVVVIFFLPFLSGETVIWQWGILSLKREGCMAALLISCRFLCILTLSFILLGTTPFLSMVKALRALGLPATLSDMMLLTYRYLHDIGQDLHTMQRAMQLRGFQSERKELRFSWTHWSRYASLVGTLLIRSYEQSERVYQAMRLRGYGRSPVAEERSGEPALLQADAVYLMAVLTLAAGFILVQLALHFGI